MSERMNEANAHDTVGPSILPRLNVFFWLIHLCVTNYAKNISLLLEVVREDPILCFCFHRSTF